MLSGMGGNNSSWKLEPPDLATPPTHPPSSQVQEVAREGLGPAAWTSRAVHSQGCGTRAPGSQQAGSPTTVLQLLPAYLV